MKFQEIKRLAVVLALGLAASGCGGGRGYEEIVAGNPKAISMGDTVTCSLSQSDCGESCTILVGKSPQYVMSGREESVEFIVRDDVAADAEIVCHCGDGPLQLITSKCTVTSRNLPAAGDLPAAGEETITAPSGVADSGGTDEKITPAAPASPEAALEEPAAPEKPAPPEITPEPEGSPEVPAPSISNATVTINRDAPRFSVRFDYQNATEVSVQGCLRTESRDLREGAASPPSISSSDTFVWNNCPLLQKDQDVVIQVAGLTGTPQALETFRVECDDLTDEDLTIQLPTGVYDWNAENGRVTLEGSVSRTCRVKKRETRDFETVAGSEVDVPWVQSIQVGVPRFLCPDSGRAQSVPASGRVIQSLTRNHYCTTWAMRVVDFDGTSKVKWLNPPLSYTAYVSEPVVEFDCDSRTVEVTLTARHVKQFFVDCDDEGLEETFEQYLNMFEGKYLPWRDVIRHRDAHLESFSCRLSYNDFDNQGHQFINPITGSCD
jgi:hypothetical protein